MAANKISSLTAVTIQVVQHSCQLRHPNTTGPRSYRGVEQPGPALAVPGAGPRHRPRHSRLLPPPRLLQRIHQLYRHAEVPPPYEGQRPARHRVVQVGEMLRNRLPNLVSTKQ